MKLRELGVDMTTMTRYRADFDCPVAFGEQEVQETLAEVLAEHRVRQLHVAETEKYAHVTYFFNGGREDEWGGEKRVLVPSPRDVPSYDHKPEMSAGEVTSRFVEEIETGDYAFAVVNFANPDMVGHTGSIPAVVKAVETAADHGRPRKRRADARGRRQEPAYGPHDEPRAADRHGARGDARGHRGALGSSALCAGLFGFQTTFTDDRQTANNVRWLADILRHLVTPAT